MKPNRLSIPPLLMAIVATVTACSGGNNQPSQATAGAQEPAPASSPAPTAPIASGNFEKAAAATTNVSGNFEVWPGPAGSTALSVQLLGLSPGEHAWHIHAGACDDQTAPVVLPFTAIPDMPALPGAHALMAGSDGTAAATVDIPRADWEKLLSGQSANSGQPGTPTPSGNRSYSIHVHQQGGVDHGPTVACANLDLSHAQAEGMNQPAGDTH